MAENSNIEWTDHTFNPWIGCTKVSAGCDHCYAETWDARGMHSQPRRWGPHAARTRTSDANWRKVLSWDRAAKAAGKRARVFCASLADVFDNHGSISFAWRSDLWALIDLTQNLDWLLLTKRPQNIARYIQKESVTGRTWPLSNVWLGTTVENQEEADRRIPHLLAVPAAKRFLSCEPLLGPVDIEAPVRAALFAGKIAPTGGDGTRPLSWVICGGESGPRARPMHPDWARSLRDQCEAAGVAFHFKQWGQWWPLDQVPLGQDEQFYLPAPIEHPDASRRCRFDSICLSPDGTAIPIGKAGGFYTMPANAFAGPRHMSCYAVGKKAAGRLLDGRTWDEVPG